MLGYVVYLEHQTLLQSPLISTTGCCLCFGSISSLFLELFLHWSPVAYWSPADQGSSSCSVLSFCLFILFMGFSRHEYWSCLPFSSPVDHVLSEFSTTAHPPWVALHSMAHSFIEFDKAVVHVIRLASFLLLWFQSVCHLMPSLSTYLYVTLLLLSHFSHVRPCATPQTSGSPVPGTLQARTLEWFAISFSNAWKWKVKVKSLCRSQLLVTLWTTAYQAPPSMGFSRQEYWSGVPLPSPPLYHRRPLTEKIGYTSLINQLLLSITCQSRNQ